LGGPGFFFPRGILKKVFMSSSSPPPPPPPYDREFVIAVVSPLGAVSKYFWTTPPFGWDKTIDGFWVYPESSRIVQNPIQNPPPFDAVGGPEIASFDGHFPRLTRGKCPSKLAISRPSNVVEWGRILDDSGRFWIDQNPSIDKTPWILTSKVSPIVSKTVNVCGCMGEVFL